MWMTCQGNRNVGTDWWLMDPDGSNKRRVTHFNQRGFPESCARPVFACLAAWSPNGNELLGCVQYSLIKQEGRIVQMKLDKVLLD
jgi:hypothetical protein